jgi:serine/threonine-protein kinase
MNKYIGKKIEGRYEITELIGDGGMAYVYKANDVLAKKVVAVKILKEEFLENEEFVRRFKNESKAIALLNHPNIVSVYDVSFSERNMAIVMEYVNGITLKDYIQKVGLLSWKDALHLTVQVLRALQHAHDNGIVHRDVKPQNIMVLSDGTVKVMDFGIARFSRSSSKTITDKAIGSVHYISPEQACGQNTDEKSDIYSVGIMLFEMLTGKLPFDADSAVSVALMQMQDEPSKPRDINSEIPEGLEEIILRAMQKDPTRRYQSAAEMLRDIDEFKKNPSISFEYKYFGGSDQATRYFDIVKVKEDETGETKNKKTLQILFGVAAGFVLLALIVVFVAISGILAPKANITIGDLRGKNINEVKADPAFATIIFKETTEYSNEYKEGEIISHAKLNQSVKEGSTISVVISLGGKIAMIPDVYGLDSATAEQRIKKEGFTIKVISKFDIEIEKDCVVETVPERNTEALYGSEVAIYVSLGAPTEYTSVPDLSGMTRETAEEKLAEYGLVADFQIVDSTLPEGKVVSQETEPDTQVATGTAIKVQISSGKPPVNTVEITIPIPKYMNSVTLMSALSGEVVDTKTYTSNYTGKDHKISVSGSGVKELVVYLDTIDPSHVYTTYTIDFDNKTVTPKLPNTQCFSKMTFDMPYNFKKAVVIRYFDGISYVEKEMKTNSANTGLVIYGIGNYIGESPVEYRIGDGEWQTYGILHIDFKDGNGTAKVQTSILDL